MSDDRSRRPPDDDRSRRPPDDDRSRRPPDDDPPLSWAPHGSASGQPPLWSGVDPVASPSGAAPSEPAHDEWTAPEAPRPAPGTTPADPPAFQPPAPPQIDGGLPPTSPEPHGGGDWPPAPKAAGAPATPTPRTPPSATVALVLGVIGLFVCPLVCSIAAIVLGTRARREIDANSGLGGRGVATAGIVLGAVGLVVFAVLVGVELAGLDGPLSI